ncbi:hypothetical protein BC831DRAFT_430948 [Entophlyctis helioformis]|nr:hypothetical protein BC831DRAFT_430948 [Entophlyctis helioformis]
MASEWVQKNWKLVAVGAVATGVVVAATAYVLSGPSAKASSTAAAAADAKDAKSPSAAAAARRKRKSSSKKSSKSKVAVAASETDKAGAAAAADAGSVENVVAAAAATAASATASATSSAPASPKDAPSAAAGEEPENIRPDHLFPANVNALTEEERKKLAQEAKTIGNKLYGDKKYSDAIDLYSQAIKLSPSAVFYGNRAAAYANLYEYENVISDCDEALKLDAKYVKALHRRGNAFENLDRLTEALNDYTVICVLEGFRNQNSMAAPDRVLKVLATRSTAEVMKTKVAKMPSSTFIAAYLDSFRAAPTHASIVADHESTQDAVRLLKDAFVSLGAREWQKAFDLVCGAIETGSFENDVVEAIAYNLRSTFHFLMGRVDLAVNDIERALELQPENINSLIKRATLFMERGEVEKTIEQFQKAETLAPKNVDLFYHRGQVKFLTGDFQGAIDDYTQSLKNEKPEESSVYVHIQMGVAKYKLGDVAGAEKKFKEAKRLFPNSAEVYNYHGEILMDRQSFPEALKSFDKAIEMDTASPLPYINKSLLHIQWKQDIVQSEADVRKALEQDPLCDIAYTHLGQLLCHQNKIPEALQVYNDAVAVSRTEAEIMNLISCREAARAQLHVTENYPGLMENLAAAAAAAGAARR